jgi:hypothetical protein
MTPASSKPATSPADRHPDPAATARRADQRPAGVAGRPGRPPDPQGQARPAQRVRLRGSSSPRSPPTPAAAPAGISCRPPAHPATPARTACLPRDGHRTGPTGPSTTRGRARRRVRARTDPADPDRTRTHQDLHLGTRRAWLPARPQAAGPLPDRLRGPHQPPSSAAMGCDAAAWRATKASGSGRAGRSWPTTWTPSPSIPPDNTRTGGTNPTTASPAKLAGHLTSTTRSSGGST